MNKVKSSVGVSHFELTQHTTSSDQKKNTFVFISVRDDSLLESECNALVIFLLLSMYNFSLVLSTAVTPICAILRKL